MGRSWRDACLSPPSPLGRGLSPPSSLGRGLRLGQRETFLLLLPPATDAWTSKRRSGGMRPRQSTPPARAPSCSPSRACSTVARPHRTGATRTCSATATRKSVSRRTQPGVRRCRRTHRDGRGYNLMARPGAAYHLATRQSRRGAAYRAGLPAEMARRGSATLCDALVRRNPHADSVVRACEDWLTANTVTADRTHSGRLSLTRTFPERTLKAPLPHRDRHHANRLPTKPAGRKSQAPARGRSDLPDRRDQRCHGL